MLHLEFSYFDYFADKFISAYLYQLTKRTFSCLRRLKNYLNNSMLNKRLCDLGISQN